MGWLQGPGQSLRGGRIQFLSSQDHPPGTTDSASHRNAWKWALIAVCQPLCESLPGHAGVRFQSSFSTWTLLTLCARSFLLRCFVRCSAAPPASPLWMPVAHPLPVTTTKNVSRHCQMSPRKQNCLQPRTTVLKNKTRYLSMDRGGHLPRVQAGEESESKVRLDAGGPQAILHICPECWEAGSRLRADPPQSQRVAT